MDFNMSNKAISLLLPVAVALMLATGFAHSQAVTPQPTSLPDAESRVYKTVGETKLMLHIFQPPGRRDGERRPAIVFFFGGGWQSGTVNQFVPQSKYLTERGMVAVIADYRVKSRHGVTPFECVADAKSAIRWVRAHAAELGVDDNRIVAAGGSAGGHLAATTALLKGFDEKNEDLKVSSLPNALVLYNPVLDMADIIERMPADRAAQISDWSKRAADISPIHHVRTGVPPTIIFHGTADTTVPFAQATRFCEAMKKQGNRCEIVPFEGRPHGFFNYGRGDNTDYSASLRKTDLFLVSLKYLRVSQR